MDDVRAIRGYTPIVDTCRGHGLAATGTHLRHDENDLNSSSAAWGGKAMGQHEVETKLQALTNSLVDELISLTPETMSEIQFEIASTADGGADIGLLENHPDARKVTLSDAVYQCASHYLPLARQYVPGWKRSLIVLRESDAGWQVSVNFERE
jgi:hypothetical protein